MFNLYSTWDNYEPDEDVAFDGDRSVSDPSLPEFACE